MVFEPGKYVISVRAFKNESLNGRLNIVFSGVEKIEKDWGSESLISKMKPGGFLLI